MTDSIRLPKNAFIKENKKILKIPRKSVNLADFNNLNLNSNKKILRVPR